MRDPNFNVPIKLAPVSMSLCNAGAVEKAGFERL
jgi:hypothetical protein